MLEDVNIDEILSKIDYGDRPSEISAMLAVLDIEHSVVIDDRIGLIGELTDKSLEHKLKHELGYPFANRELEKRGDYFQVVSEFGEILLEEDVTTVFVIDNHKGYAFMVKDMVAEDSIGSFFKLQNTEDVIVIYDANGLRTNCKDLKYKYDDTISIKRVDFYESSSWVIEVDSTVYSSYVINLNNRIYGLKEKVG